MAQRFAWTGGVVLALLLTAQPAQALIDKPIPLKDVLEASNFILVAKVEKLDPDKPAVVLAVTDDLKGKARFRQLPINLTGDSDAKKLNHTPQLLKRLAVDLPILLFISQRDKQYVGFGYSNGTWFQMTGLKDNDSDLVRWSFTHCEPALRGTFKGSTTDLKQVVVDGLAGKKEPPPPDLKEKPGLGPEVESKDKNECTLESMPRLAAARRAARFSEPPLNFAVIPTVVVGGPLALLAVLFPAVFGGLLLMLRRWMAVLTVASINSTLYLIWGWDWFDEQLTSWKLAWVAGPLTMWLVMTLVTLLGALWAWHRHLQGQQAVQEFNASFPPPPGSTATLPDANLLILAERPRRGEHLVLWGLSLGTLAALAWGVYDHQPLLVFPWTGVWVLAAGLWIGTLYTFLLRYSGRHEAWSTRAALPVEGLVLGAMLCAALPLGATVLPHTTGGAGLQEGAAAVEEGERPITLTGIVWTAELGGKGSVDGSPLVAGNRVYVGTYIKDVFYPEGQGALCCLDAENGEVKWRFLKDGDQALHPVFSEPCLADGRLYFGEGYHQHNECKFFCLKAETGEKVWDFKTGNHTESSPAIAGGKVFFGAGDDGLYCLNAADKKEQWHYQAQLHIDSNPTVVGNRLYCGGGVIDQAVYDKRMAVFCLDTDTGKEVWNLDTELPVLGAPVVAGDQVFVPLSNCNFGKDAESPKGALLCVDARTGKKLWQKDVDHAVLTRPAVDGQSVYFGSKNKEGSFYCLARKDGELRWKRDLGSPVLASPALVRCSCCGKPLCLYVLGSTGQIACLNPTNGKAFWLFDLAEKTQTEPLLLSSPAVMVIPDPAGERRRICFGATLNGDRPKVFCLEDRLGGE